MHGLFLTRGAKDIKNRLIGAKVVLHIDDIVAECGHQKTYACFYARITLTLGTKDVEDALIGVKAGLLADDIFAEHVQQRSGACFCA